MTDYSNVDQPYRHEYQPDNPRTIRTTKKVEVSVELEITLEDVMEAVTHMNGLSVAMMLVAACKAPHFRDNLATLCQMCSKDTRELSETLKQISSEIDSHE